MNDRLKWALLRRRRLKETVEGFSASLLSHATPDCRFEGHLRQRFAPELCEALLAPKRSDDPLEALRHCAPQIERSMDPAVLGELKERQGAFADAAPW